MDTANAIFYVIILIMSVVIHEVSHGYVANYFGDKTALYAGRLTLNPIRHLDLFGSVILPMLLVLSGTGLVFGWAKPVPYNERNLSNLKWGRVAVAAAGAFSNFLIAIFFGILIRYSGDLGILGSAGLESPAIIIMSTIVLVNLMLGFFNLIPIPPLDGSAILFSFLPPRLRHIENTLEQYGFIILIAFILLVPNFISPIVFNTFTFLTGVGI